MITFLFSFLWGNLAKKIVMLENKRTQAQFNRALTMRLAFVKLFIFFIPLIRLGFLAPVSSRICAEGARDFEDGAAKVAGIFFSQGPPNNLQQLNITQDDPVFMNWVYSQRVDAMNSPISNALLVLADFEDLFEVQNTTVHIANRIAGHTDGDICFRGCHPGECEIVVQGMKRSLQCHNTCVQVFERSLNVIYISHSVCTLIFIVVPMLLVRLDAKREIAAGGGENGEPYTLLQYQEKCHIQANYEYLSWGGSYVEDFLEVVLGFSVLVCFSLVSPSMAIIGLIAQVIEYRLLMYRMTWVTCRPFPTGTQGLSEWLMILDVVMYLAICLNAMLLICVLRTDLGNRSSVEKLLVIVIMTLALIVANIFLRISLHEPPRELSEAMDQNHDFTHALRLLRNPDPEMSRRVGDAHLQIGVGNE